MPRIACIVLCAYFVREASRLLGPSSNLSEFEFNILLYHGYKSAIKRFRIWYSFGSLTILNLNFRTFKFYKVYRFYTNFRLKIFEKRVSEGGYYITIPYTTLKEIIRQTDYYLVSLSSNDKLTKY